MPGTVTRAPAERNRLGGEDERRLVEAATRLHLYVPDADEVYLTALEAGAESHTPPRQEQAARGTLRGMSLEGWLQERLFERRIVLVTGRLDDEAAARAAAALLALDAREDRPIELHVDSPDGSLEAAFALIDAVDGLRSVVRVLCRGLVGGPVLGVIAAADHRVAAPHARFHLCQPTARFAGTPEHIGARSRQQRDLLWRLCARLSHRTRRPAETIAEDLRRGRYLDAREALDYGLVDEITGR